MISRILNLLRCICAPLALLFSAVTQLRRTAYNRGWLRSIRLTTPVISIGNITVGGTGKTPFIRAVAQALHAAGKKPAIVSRGYGGSYTGILTVSDGSTVSATAARAGDEPVQLARQLPGIPVIVCRDRALGGTHAIREFSPDVILLDDGMQHLKLQRDLDIVLIDATNPFGSGFTLPCGRLREPFSALRHAGHIIITKTNQMPDTSAIYQQFERLAISSPVSEVPFTTDYVTDITNGTTSTCNKINNLKLFAFSGLGNNTSFFTSCKNSLLDISATASFPDHHTYTSRDITSLGQQAATCGADAFITSEKDAARLSEHPLPLPLYTLNLTMQCPEAVLNKILALL